MNTRWRWFLRLGIGYCGAFGTAMSLILAFSTNSTLAQELKPIADDSLGAESSVVTPINTQVDTINGGAIRGTNLFHSFSQFHIGEGREAYFTNPFGIENILSRVTGSDASKIFGKLGVLGNANLFLINPNGIIFGANASLDIRGSFVASTASSLKFADGTEFSAKTPQTLPLLTINMPIGLQYGANLGKIQVIGDGQGIRTTTELIDTENALRVQPNQTLALVGGDVSLEGATLKTAGGRIELGSVAGESFVSLTSVSKGFALGYDAVQNFGNIQISQQAAVDASGTGGGEIQVRGGRITLSNGSQIETSTLGAEAGGAMLVNASELLELSDTSGLFAVVYPSATGTGGDLTINTRDLLVRGGALIRSRTRGGGKGGNLTVTADKVQLIGISTDGQFISSVAARSESDATGDAGDLTINTNELLIRDGALVSTSTFGRGKGGNLTVTANKVQLIGTSTDGEFVSGLFARANPSASGDAGDLTINTQQLLIQDGAWVATDTMGPGRGGNLTVKATDYVELIGRSVLKTETYNAGAAGNLTIETGKLLVRDFASVSAETWGEGPGGRLEVTAADSVKLIHAGDLSTSSYESGDAGSLTITTGKLLVQNGSGVRAFTFSGEGRGGNLTVNAKESVELSNEPGFGPSALVTSTIADAKGDAGNITISTGKLTIKDGASVRAQTLGEGRGGNLTVTARELVELIGISVEDGEPSGLFTSNSTIGGNTNPRGSAGNVMLATGKLIVRDGAQINVSSEGTANAGNLQIHARSIHLDNQAKLTAQTASGSGGNIILQNRDLLLLRRGSLISATAGTAGAGGDGGNIDINAPSGFIVTVPDENSDVTANAFNGNGGQVTINATGIFGMIPRSREDLVKLLQTNDPNQLDPIRLLTNDISAISQANASLNGVVTINTPDVDPSRGLVELPVNLVDAEQQIASGCTPRGGQTSSFLVTGRGGLPLSPQEPLRPRAVVTQWVTLDEQTGNQKDAEAKPMALSERPADNREPIVEANGWVVDKRGDVRLVAQPLNTMQSNRNIPSAYCAGS